MPVRTLQPPRPGVVYGLMALLCAVWGSTWVVIAKGLRDLPPFTGAAARFVVAAVVMAALSPFLRRREGGRKPPWSVVLAQASCQFAGNYGIVYWAETVLPSGLVSVLWSTFPLMMALSGHYVTKSERLLGQQWLGLLVAFFGVVALFGTDVPASGERAIVAALLLLLAPAAVTFSTLLIKRRAYDASSVLLNRDSMWVGAIMLLALAWIFEGEQQVHWTPLAIGSVLYLAIFGTVLTFGVYLWLLRTTPAYRLSLISYVTPVVALAMGAAVAAEPIGAGTLVGTGLVLAGVGLTLRRRPAASRP